MRERVVRKKIQIFSRRQQARVGDGGIHTPVVWTSALLLYYDVVDLRGIVCFVHTHRQKKKKKYHRAIIIRSGLSLFPSLRARERGVRTHASERPSLIENDSTRLLHFYYVFRRKTPIVAANETEMDPVRSTAGG